MTTGPHTRCAWAENDPLMRAYHDQEWGRPERESRRLWEALMLDGFQAGLAWITILRKREAFRAAFANFDPKRVATFGEEETAKLLQNAGIVRSRAKIEATISGRTHLSGHASPRREFRLVGLVVRRRETDPW
jgi:DNA-3-methyladenine glycosylase I